jgi:protein-S-isoprenylcysteine O-methyltransferase Ste14
MHSRPALFMFFLMAYGFSEVAILRKSKIKFRAGTKDLTYYAVTVPGVLAMGVPVWVAFNFGCGASNWRCIAGVILVALGVFIRLKGVLELKENFSTIVEKKENHLLIKSGLHSVIRHPAYLGTAILAFAFTAALAPWPWLFIFPAATVIGLLLRIRREEKFLLAELPGYGEYIKNTWKLIPWLF